MIECVGNNCTGCNACVATCPINAITLIKDKKGFWYPKVDEKLCVSCQICKNVCPTISHEEFNIFEVYSAYSNSEHILKNSSSGGIFYYLAQSCLKNNGIVIGASIDYVDNRVKHCIVENENELSKIMRSKYVQSYIAPTIYNKIIDELKKGRLVLFSGTPCQVSGVKNFVRGNYDNLILIDIVCHGSPSPFAWKKYTQYMEKKYRNKISDCSFRSKENGWTKYEMSLSFGKEKYSRWFNNDLWGKSFINNVFLRECCFKCKFKDNRRVGDISLGDFWGIDKDKNPKDLGCSLVLINTENGKKIWNDVKSNLIYSKEVYDVALKGNYALQKSSERFPYSNIAYNLLRIKVPFNIMITLVLGMKKIRVKLKK